MYKNKFRNSNKLLDNNPKQFKYKNNKKLTYKI